MRTTTAINACDVALWLDDNAGAPVDISGSSNQVRTNLDNNIGKFSVFQAEWPGRLECGKDATITLQIIYSSAADEGWDVLKQWYFTKPPGSRSLAVYIPDKNIGSDKFYGEMKLSSLNWTSSRDEAGPILVTATLLPDGDFDWTIAAT